MDITQALTEAVDSTFADMAFMDAEPEPAHPGEPNPGQVIAIEFLQPLGGYLMVHLSATTKQLIIENIHGVDWESLSGSEVDDCLMELVNIMAGNFLILVGAGESRHSLSLPQVLYDQSDLTIDNELVDYYFSVNGEMTRVSLKYAPGKKDGIALQGGAL